VKRRIGGTMPAVEMVIDRASMHAPEDARALTALLDPRLVKVDLIDVNGPTGGFHRASREARSAFLDVLAGAGIPFAIRYSGGQDVQAGCGQLAAGGGLRGAGLFSRWPQGAAGGLPGQ